MEAINYYEKLVTFGKIEIQVSDGISVPLIFKKNNFYHLAGLHKLSFSVLELISSRSHSERVRTALNKCKELDIQNAIKGDANYNEIRDRIYYFNRFLWVITCSKVKKIEGVKGEGTSIDGDYYFIFEICEKFEGKIKKSYLDLFVKKDFEGVFVPSSFYIRDNFFEEKCFPGAINICIDKVELNMK